MDSNVVQQVLTPEMAREMKRLRERIQRQKTRAEGGTARPAITVEQVVERFAERKGVQPREVSVSYTSEEREQQLASLPVELREQVQRRVLTLEKASAWARLLAAFDNDDDALRTALWTILA